MPLETDLDRLKMSNGQHCPQGAMPRKCISLAKNAKFLHLAKCPELFSKHVPSWLQNQSLCGNELIAPLWSNLLVNMCHAGKMMCEKLQISYLNRTTHCHNATLPTTLLVTQPAQLIATF